MRLSEIYFSSEIFYTYLNLLCINKCMYFYIHKYVYFKVMRLTPTPRAPGRFLPRFFFARVERVGR